MPEQPPAADWDTYWRGTWEAAAHTDGSPQDEALRAFWRSFFEDPGTPRSGWLLDAACGNGAVVRYARELAAQDVQLLGLDYSPSALKNLRQRYPGVACVAADAYRPPLPAASLNLVVSQFGIEYAGVDAIHALAALVAPGGRLGLVMHRRDGAIYAECARNLRALQQLQETRFLELSLAAFTAGFALNARRGTVEEFRAAERAFSPAVRAVESLLQREGRDVAGGFPGQLYADVSRTYQRMSAFDKAEVLGWLQGLMPELDAYIGRMSSMTAAALDEPTIASLCQRLEREGFEAVKSGALQIGMQQRPGGWLLTGLRPRR